ncbi:cytochrome P450 [Streptomyces sp. NPDC050617]|uniref:cytochrome P450 n=1 Tax=Streptomyces sp. NPDC050617 TaxID=3154628 RepID=UPI00343E5ADB
MTPPTTTAGAPEPAELQRPFPWPRPAVDPPAAYGWLRENAPIRRVELVDGLPGWLVTRYEDVRELLADPRVSSDASAPGYSLLGAPRLTGKDQSFLRSDPPYHTVFRRMLGKHFAVKRVHAMRPRIQELVDETIDELLGREERPVDLVEHLALPIPSTVLSWLLGVPAEDQAFFNKASEDLLARGRPNVPDAEERAAAARTEMVRYIAKLSDERLATDDPGEDMLGDMAKAVKDGTISRESMINSGVTLLVAGHETTANMTALGTAILLQHPDQLTEMRAEPGLRAGAIEELLRFLTIVHLIVVRVAKEDIEVAGQVIPKGEAIIPLNFSANRDDAHYPNPDVFDIHRAPRDHLAFGFGIHQCMGQPLARLELDIIFETLFRRMPGLRLATEAESLPYKTYAPINGLTGLPVTW